MSLLCFVPRGKRLEMNKIIFSNFQGFNLQKLSSWVITILISKYYYFHYQLPPLDLSTIHLAFFVIMILLIFLINSGPSKRRNSLSAWSSRQTDKTNLGLLNLSWWLYLQMCLENEECPKLKIPPAKDTAIQTEMK